ncbi:hypothetical protein [Parvularcula oceani]|uniref:hypothetical protein n=1 Tax=Parvularcula oceani TaxID=1247963 RepID=UPI0004E1FC18|nr:hypothetical protein [Parvularcula oceani]
MAKLAEKARPADIVLVPEVNLDAVKRGGVEETDFYALTRRELDAEEHRELSAISWYMVEPCYFPHTTRYDISYFADDGTLLVQGGALGRSCPTERRPVVVGITGGAVERVIYSFGMAE